MESQIPEIECGIDLNWDPWFVAEKRLKQVELESGSLREQMSGIRSARDWLQTELDVRKKEEEQFVQRLNHSPKSCAPCATLLQPCRLYLV